ncbi:peptidoglycan D,D-transpeptidase FtsI family protein [Moraxella oculi]|uniref:Peptidoglycan D,D-transpeptidase FtsI family protein n=1 Tax=Moraxella oculi TaxID=2940516 RepID=A0ABW8U677_9GAMM
MMKKTTQKKDLASKITPSSRKKSPKDDTKDKNGIAKPKHSKHGNAWSWLLNKLGLSKRRSQATRLGGMHDAWRYRLIWAVMAFGFAALFVRAFYLQVVNSSFLIDMGDKIITAKITMPAHRGMITDTTGVPLAANAPLSTIVFSPYDYAKRYYELLKIVKTSPSQSKRDGAPQQLKEMDLVKLSGMTNFPLKTLQKAVAIDNTIDVSDADAVKAALPKGAGSKRMVLQQKVSPELVEPIKKLKFVGVSEDTIFQRYYLQAEPNAQILGYMAQSKDATNGGYVGRAGIEAKYEKQLAGEPGRVLLLKSKDAAVKELKELKPQVEGQDLQLTIDSRLQYVLYKELEQVGRVQSARSSSGIVVDVLTGDVLAMGSWPSFNSNNLAERTGANERNRPVLDTFEPGSIMKPFTVAAALESGKYSVNSLINTTPGKLYVGGYTIRDSADYGSITMAKLIQKSSNVASAKIALSLGVNDIADMQRRFGFGQKTALNFPAEASGSVKNPSGEKDTTRRATLSYGYGQSVTLAQVAQAYATLANHGQMHPLRLVKNEKPVEPTQVIEARHADAIVKMMELVTEPGGTARAAAINGYRVAGKTGTSRRAKPEGGYHADQYRTTFAGIAPASNPRFAVVILVEDPRRQHYGGVVAAPVFHNVMKEVLRLYNVPFDKPLQADVKDLPRF